MTHLLIGPMLEMEGSYKRLGFKMSAKVAVKAVTSTCLAPSSNLDSKLAQMQPEQYLTRFLFHVSS